VALRTPPASNPARRILAARAWIAAPGWIAAVDIGGTSTKFGLVDENGCVKALHRMRTKPPVERFLSELLGGVAELRRLEPLAAGIGVSVAGFVDPAHSMMIYNPNLPWLEGIPLRARLEEKFGLPVTLEIDSNAAALAEYRFGNGAGAQRFLSLTVGTGIGGGFLVDGRLVRFTQECIGDVIVSPGGPRCSCGAWGCAEAMVRTPEVGAALGLLCASLGAIFFPDRIVLGGGVCAGSGEVIETARETFARSAGDAVRKASILPAKLGANAPLIGARIGSS
jgi:predicted NBD/HSP70 family sugar kinase